MTQTDIDKLLAYAYSLDSRTAAIMLELLEALEYYANFEENTDDGVYEYHEDGDPSNMMTRDEGGIADAALVSAAALIPATDAGKGGE